VAACAAWRRRICHLRGHHLFMVLLSDRAWVGHVGVQLGPVRPWLVARSCGHHTRIEGRVVGRIAGWRATIGTAVPWVSLMCGHSKVAIAFASIDQAAGWRERIQSG
jgi:hypothetical protein